MRIDGQRVATDDDAEILLSRHVVGDSVTLSYTDLAGREIIRPSVTVLYEGPLVIGFKLLVAVAILGLGAVVFYFRPPSLESALFCFATVSFAVAVTGTKTIYAMPPPWFGTILCGAFFLAYAALAACFLHFTQYFSRVPRRPPRWMGAVYVLALGVAGWDCASYLHDVRDHDVARYDASFLPSVAMNAFVVAMIVLGVATVVRTYRTAPDLAERKKLRWALFGLSVGPAPFVIGQALPQALGRQAIVPESIMLAFLLVIPVAFAIAIVRHRLLNIDLIINRSIVYGVTLGALVVAATVLFGLIATMVDTYARLSSPVMFIVVAVSVAMLFQPVKSRVQEFVDRRFFLVRYNYRQTQRRLFDGIRRAFEPRALARLVISEIQRVMPVERASFFACDPATYRLRVLAHDHFDILEDRGVPLRVDALRSSLQRPVGDASAVEPGLDVEIDESGLFQRWGIALAFACLSEDGRIIGFLVLGRKRSGFRFLAEDVDLLAAIAGQAGLALERIAAQERLLLEHEETERLSRLSQLKSYFVSSVSHDLKTPLTSIRMFAELLRNTPELSAAERSEYLEIIEGESDRLTRMINGVLDFSMIEKGVKSYHIASADLNDEVERVLRSLGYRLRMERFTLERTLAPGALPVRLDTDAFAEALWNLVGNAMKYSPHDRWIGVETLSRDGYAGVRVRDRGRGIPQGEQARIFEQFYRVDAAGENAPGAGLGLAIVKHIVDGHGGSVEVESTEGAGSTFTLWLPKEGFDETHTRH
jgi:signal transduction histidine kinase